MPSRTVFGGCFQHAHQQCCLFGVDFGWGFVKIGSGGRLDTHGLIPEINGVEVHGQYLILGVFAFQFGGHYPFFEFEENQFHLVHLLVAREQVLGQLLGDSAAAALVVEGEHTARHTEQGAHIHTGVLVKTRVLRGNQGIL